MNYYQYKAEDFASDDDFKRWVLEPDTGSDAFWEEFLKQNPEKYYAINEGRALVLGLQTIPHHPEVEKRVDRLRVRVENTINRESRLSRLRLLSVLAAASVLVLVAGWGWLGFSETSQESLGSFGLQEKDLSWEEIVNSTPVAMRISLPDETIVVLEKNSSLRYQTQFSDSVRAVFLKGVAFFDVKKDVSRPFMVHANGLITKVLGTSFSVSARDEEPNVTVAVKTGRVSVYSDKPVREEDPEVDGIVLTPNQKAVFTRSKETLSKTLVESPEILPGDVRESFSFESASAKDVFEALSRNYGVEVLYDEELVKDCMLTIDLTNEDLFQKLEVICKVIDVRYKLIDAQVVVYGNGCS